MVGLLLGNVLLKLRNLGSYKTWKKAIWWYSLIMFLLLFIGVLFINIFYSNLEYEDDIARGFRILFDSDGDGLLTEDELRTAMSKDGEPTEDSVVNLMIASADLDEDGKINVKEFQNLLHIFKARMTS